MHQLQPHETELTGRWIAEAEQVRADAVCERIEWLVKSYLVQVAYSREGGGWETLYRDPNDGRLWERSYPQSKVHGGGPPRLLLLTPEQAVAKYDRVVEHNS